MEINLWFIRLLLFLFISYSCWEVPGGVVMLVACDITRFSTLPGGVLAGQKVGNWHMEVYIYARRLKRTAASHATVV